ncbi:PLP-dependent aminotransferase family protein [Stutzerimonas urumqiensis]|uniref:MocR-like pyridoxine biosynthesis transcription factor PdxR n=1 Tax=Stutzerimonas urumqiensis TaxID=638269 RepID=UPI003BA8E251
MDLHIAIDPQQPLAQQIYRQLHDAILAGHLPHAVRLPATRELSRRLLVSRRTVSDAYERLLAEGLLHTRRGHGTFVERPGQPPRPQPMREPEAPLLTPHPAWPFRQPRPPERDGKRWRYDFIGGSLNLARFPFGAWRNSLQRALQVQAAGHGGLGEAAGHRPLRQAIAHHLAAQRAVRCSADDVLITQGAQQALTLIAQVVLGPGARIAMEEPGYTPARHCFMAAGADVVGIPVDAEGLCVERLPADVRAVYVTPSHQFPLGMPLSLPRRRALLDWARRHRVLIIEDDYDGEYRFEGRPMESLQGLDRHGLVAYLGTFSKTMFPELRLGFVTLPPGLAEPLIAAKQLVDRHSCALQQYALADFIERGEFARHTQRMQRIYTPLRAALLEALQGPLSPWLEPVVPLAGIHIAAWLQPGIDLSRLRCELTDAEIGIGDLAYFHQGTARDGLLFGFGNIERHALEAGLKAMRECFPRCVERSAGSHG